MQTDLGERMKELLKKKKEFLDLLCIKMPKLKAFPTIRQLSMRTVLIYGEGTFSYGQRDIID